MTNVGINGILAHSLEHATIGTQTDREKTFVPVVIFCEVNTQTHNNFRETIQVKISEIDFDHARSCLGLVRE